MLKMKKVCEKCNSSTSDQEEAYICSFECTFCAPCNEELNATCPNCDGELLLRPKRTRKPIEVAASQIKSKLFG
ncbi:MAG: DUF1272 domain-containing protein [Pseudomonadales bacterium]|nr:DUF1272 domain-containing protein [Pseudomonadales bacterium]